MARTFGTPQGHFLSLPQPFSKAHVLNMWFLVKASEFPNDFVCNEMSAPCGLARQQVRSKAEFAHPCVESFVPSRKQDVSKCLAHVVCWPRWYDMLWPWLQPSGTKWNQVRIQATLLGFLGRHFSTTKWNQVDPSGSESGSEPLCLEFWDHIFLQPSGSKWIRVRIRAVCLEFWPKPSPPRLLI